MIYPFLKSVPKQPVQWGPRKSYWQGGEWVIKCPGRNTLSGPLSELFRISYRAGKNMNPYCWMTFVRTWKGQMYLSFETSWLPSMLLTMISFRTTCRGWGHCSAVLWAGTACGNGKENVSPHGSELSSLMFLVSTWNHWEKSSTGLRWGVLNYWYIHWAHDAF